MRIRITSRNSLGCETFTSLEQPWQSYTLRREQGKCNIFGSVSAAFTFTDSFVTERFMHIVFHPALAEGQIELFDMHNQQSHSE
jgi:hypothetical protein